MKWLISCLMLLTIPTLLVACGYNQEEMQQAWDSAYQQGYNEGYTQGWQDAPKGQPESPTPQPTQKIFVGSINSDIYHYPHCEWAKKISPQNEIWFSSVADAKQYGYRPCKVCRPP